MSTRSRPRPGRRGFQFVQIICLNRPFLGVRLLFDEYCHLNVERFTEPIHHILNPKIVWSYGFLGMAVFQLDELADPWNEFGFVIALRTCLVINSEGLHGDDSGAPVRVKWG